MEQRDGVDLSSFARGEEENGQRRFGARIYTQRPLVAVGDTNRD
jgi:hypothetical protein